MDEQNSSEDGIRGDGGEDVPQFLVHLYRGELDRVTTWRGRLDQTINWAVTIMAAVLTWVFSSGDNPHYLLLIGMLTVATFHLIETRRYRTFDVFRSRVRLMEEEVFADALDPAGESEVDWRERLGADLRRPAVKTPFFEAYARRLRRVYLPLLYVLLAAWVARITVFTPDEGVLASAAVVGVPGEVVIVAVGGTYLVATGFAFWPRERQAKGELYDREEEGEWKNG